MDYTYCMSINANMLIDHLFDYTSLLSVFLAVSVFLLIKNISWDNLNEKSVAVLASCTMGVYLIHIQINTIFPFAQTNLIYRILGTFCLYILSIIIVLLIKKMPIINKVVP